MRCSQRALALAKLGIEDLKEGAEITRRRLEDERTLLATATRRRTLAEGINDAETAMLAAKYEAQHTERVSVVVVNSQRGQYGIEVEVLLGQQQTVIKPLGRLFKTLRGISGSSILGSGEVALILDVNSLGDLVTGDATHANRAGASAG